MKTNKAIEISTIENLNPTQLFASKGAKLSTLLVAIRKQFTAEVPDISTEEGRKRIASLAHKVARTKTAIDTVGKNFVSEQKLALSAIDERRKESRDYLDRLKLEVRKPLNDYEEKEQKRIDKIHAKITHITNQRFPTDPDSGALRTADDLDISLIWLRQMTVGKGFQEFKEQAEEARQESIGQLVDQWIPKAEKREADEAELEQRRKVDEQARQAAHDKRIADEAVAAAALPPDTSEVADFEDVPFEVDPAEKPEPTIASELNRIDEERFNKWWKLYSTSFQPTELEYDNDIEAFAFRVAHQAWKAAGVAS